MKLIIIVVLQKKLQVSYKTVFHCVNRHFLCKGLLFSNGSVLFQHFFFWNEYKITVPDPKVKIYFFYLIDKIKYQTLKNGFFVRFKYGRAQTRNSIIKLFILISIMATTFSYWSYLICSISTTISIFHVNILT